MKKITLISIIILIFYLFTLSAFAHSGGTDSKGGHYDHSTGEYHYHHGYPPHNHYNGECPYLVKEETQNNTSYNSSKSSNSTFITVIVILLIIIFGVPLGASAIVSIIEFCKEKRRKKILNQYKIWEEKNIDFQNKMCENCEFCKFLKIDFWSWPNKCKLLKIKLVPQYICKIEEHIKDKQ